MQDTGRWLLGGRRVPVRLWLAILPLATGLGLVGYVVAGISLWLGFGLLAAVGLGVAALAIGRTPADQRSQLRRRALAGALGGLLGTLAYDACRYLVVTTLGFRFWPFDIFPIFGQLLAGSLPRGVQVVVGVLYHEANGIGFGLAYVFFFGRPRLLTALLWAAILELAMISIYPSWLHLKALAEFYSVSVVGHAAYGSVLGLVSRRLIQVPGAA